MMIKLNRIHHIAIICTDYEKSKHFYTEILGLKIVREVYREQRRSYKLDLEIAGQYQVELFSFPEPPPRPSSPEATGLRHVAFEVDNIDEATFHIKEYGVIVEPIRVDEFTGKRFTFFPDPDGLPIELVEK
jgi:glyoxylase I family protein